MTTNQSINHQPHPAVTVYCARSRHAVRRPPCRRLSRKKINEKKGSSFIEQLSLIFDVIGSPAPSEVEHIRGAQARKFLLEVEGKAHVAFTELLPGTDEDGANLLDLLLRFDPEKRCTPAQGLLHPFFASIK